MPNVKLILVGGFLGAGKTTLLSRAAEVLARRGLRVGLITNDQAAHLVDTELLRQSGQAVQEVAGACFCCAFNKLLYVCDNLIASHHPDVILGEPVGSCTDLAATVIAPLKRLCPDRFDVAPYSVLVDPDKLMETLAALQTGDLAAAIRYIYQKQIEEADLVVVNKVDSLGAGKFEKIAGALSRQAPHAPVVGMSARSGEGVEAWLDRVLAGGPAGTHIADVDYDTYAAGEAALGWLNAAADLAAPEPTDWKLFASTFMAAAQTALAGLGADIAHLKILLISEGGRLLMNLTSSAGVPSVQGGLLTPTRRAALVVNARVRTSPEQLQSTVESALRRAAGASITLNLAELTSFRPGRPEPLHRYDPSGQPRAGR
ncbi:MAG: cobalamin biosynthesis protein P47K [Planctomycetota bacterium]|nr:cobalamin biosynthesis protein P47K [Planctomycetota bacterium]